MNVLKMAARQVERGVSSVRQAYRAVLSALDLERQVQLVNIRGEGEQPVPAVELFQHYGFTSAPPDGSQAIVLPLGGKSARSVVVATEPAAPGRFQLDARGETAVYSTVGGSVIHLRADGSVLIDAPGPITVNAPSAEIDVADVHMTGNLRVDGDITDRAGSGGSSMHGMRDTYNTHTHPENDSGGPTGEPNEEM